MKLNGVIDEQGNIKLAYRDNLISWAKQNAGKKIAMEVKTVRKHRSISQNKYLWGVVTEMVWLGLVELGHDVSKEETHEFLKGKFNSKQVMGDGGLIETIPQSTARMTTTEMMDYIAKIQQWAAEFLNIVIPDPNQDILLFTGDTINNQQILITEKTN